MALLGIFLGAWLASKIKTRFESLLVAVPILIGFIYLNYMSLLHFYQSTGPAMRISESLVFSHKFVIGAFFALGPMILFGALIPSLMRKEGEVALNNWNNVTHHKSGTLFAAMQLSLVVFWWGLDLALSWLTVIFVCYGF